MAVERTNIVGAAKDTRTKDVYYGSISGAGLLGWRCRRWGWRKGTGGFRVVERRRSEQFRTGKQDSINQIQLVELVGGGERRIANRSPLTRIMQRSRA
jgi:hypothetical protein